ncbi:MAG: oligopeptidase A [Gammaproteobacteria bacterium]|nr:oligopeptidase A [Gammaproteobacteria bacterium]
MTNPLLSNTELPLFSQIKPEHVEPAIDQVLNDARADVENCLQRTNDYTWENLIEPLEQADNRINKAWSPVSHLNSVMNNDELRVAYNACIPKLSEYSTEMGQHEGLYKAYSAIAKSHAFAAFNTAQKKVINNALRDFKLSGIALEPEKKQRFKEISQELSTLASRFEENVLDATNAWSKLLINESELAGLPETALEQAKQAAEQEGKTGWLINLQFPSFHAVMTYADNRELRREHYEAYSTKASDQGPNAGQWDNSDIMEKLLALRHEKAQLLGFNNYAELSLATKMAKKPADVLTFLEDLAAKSLPQARQDLTELHTFAEKEHGINDLQPWDIGYYSEKMRQHFYQLSQEEIKAYFPITRVLPGMFTVVEKLYGLKISEIKDFYSWHSDVRFFQIIDRNGQLRGKFFLDLYARSKKRGGAWMDDCVGRAKFHDTLQTPVAYLTCNFTPAVNNQPALLTHDELTTLFHEFGHGLHHMLTQIDYLGVSGINGVEWDAVELPSQFMENWCWEKEALQLLSGHYQTSETLPDSLYDKMVAAKNFQAGMIMVRQLEFALFDFLIHLNYDPKLGGRIYETLNKVREKVAVVIPPAFNRFAHSFGHIFAGGYAAGYYSYKWAEVLSSDAYSLFEEQGIFNPETGNAFLTNILERGGSQNAMELFVKFRGRKPTIDALLRHNGIGIAA